MSIAQIFGVGGPLAGLATFLGFLLKGYLDKRGADRADVKTSRESESGIVETSRMALELARAEMTAMDTRRGKEREEYENEIRDLKAEIRKLRERLQAAERPK